jgi:DNA ligase-1
MLKVKQFSDAEYKVIDVELGEMDDGHGNKIKVLSKIIIEHKGNRVGVGSGFTIEERVGFYNNPEEIVGKEVTIKYFAESVNQNGGCSLRFPVIKSIHGEKREL